MALGRLCKAAELLQVQTCGNVQRWALDIAARPVVHRGRMVNRKWGPAEERLHERRDARDFATRTDDKLSPAAG